MNTFFEQTFDAQAITLLHEYFHLYGADDFSAAEIAAGDSDDFHVIAHKLALSNPARAITNAYNLQFYFTGE